MIAGAPVIPLDAWLLEQPNAAFPTLSGATYQSRLRAATEYLNTAIHPHVEKGATLADGGYLTDHGPDHIKTVIQRASELIGAPTVLRPYESYLLVLAIHFHDVGNIFGRAGHEKKHAEIMHHLGLLLGDDTVEQRIIRRIAEAHGGTVNGDKDTISRLEPEEGVFGVSVRLQLLAAILRFADELADDSRRAARVMMRLGKIPRSSEVFHQYANSLSSVSVDKEHRSVELRYNLHRPDALRKFGKGSKTVYLLDEIFERTLKMHAERIYCSRFMRDIVPLDEINVRILVYPSTRHSEPEWRIAYSLKERGYPKAPINFKELCPEINWTGASLKKALREIK